MKHIFLTSSIDDSNVAESVYDRLKFKYSPNTAFIMTPVESEKMIGIKTWEGEERDALNRAGFSTFDYTITDKDINQIHRDLSNIEVLYISGGNELYFKEKCNQSNFQKFVEDFVESGKPYIGTSSGSIIMGKDMGATLALNDLSCLREPVDTNGFGIVDFSILPHWGLDDFRDQYIVNSFDEMFNTSRKLIALNNYQYVEVLGDKYRIIDVRREND